MIRKNKKYLALSANKRPLFGPWHDVYATDIEKANTRQALREAMREELYEYYDELDDADRYNDY